MLSPGVLKRSLIRLLCLYASQRGYFCNTDGSQLLMQSSCSCGGAHPHNGFQGPVRITVMGSLLGLRRRPAQPRRGVPRPTRWFPSHLLVHLQHLSALPSAGRAGGSFHGREPLWFQVLCSARANSPTAAGPGIQPRAGLSGVAPLLPAKPVLPGRRARRAKRCSGRDQRCRGKHLCEQQHRGEDFLWPRTAGQPALQPTG